MGRGLADQQPIQKLCHAGVVTNDQDRFLTAVAAKIS